MESKVKQRRGISVYPHSSGRRFDLTGLFYFTVNFKLRKQSVKDLGKFKIVIATLTIITIIFGTVKKASIKHLLSIKYDGNLRTHPPTHTLINRF
jgi:hypothetical protein